MTRYVSPTETVFADNTPSALRFQRCELEVQDGPDKGTQVAVGQRRIRVGTSAENDLVLTDRAVSRFHAEIDVQDDGFLIRDAASKNGVFIGSVRIKEAILTGATTLKLGNTTISFRPGNDTVEFQLTEVEKFGDAIGNSVGMRELFTLLERAASTDLTVLLEGETGTGKELLAEGIHLKSSRASKPFMVVDCGSIPRELMEAELYGAMKGAYTGANADRAGIFEAANGGTVFLDELGELALDLQPKLLRVIERGEIRRVGASKTIKIDVRLVAATNRDLLAEVSAGRFRQDLYYRLSVVKTRIPPLRDRRDDIPIIAKAMAQEIAKDFSDVVDAGAASHVGAIVARYKDHSWPGNVRELRNVIERTLVLASLGEQSEKAVGVGPDEEGGEEKEGISHVTFKVAKHDAIRRFESEYLLNVMSLAGNNVSKAARLAGMDRRNFQKMIRKHDIRKDNA